MDNMHFQEPRADIHKPEDLCGISIVGDPNKFSASDPGDPFDQFLSATGGPPAPRGGHADAVAAHKKKIALPDPTVPGEYVFGEKGIILPVHNAKGS